MAGAEREEGRDLSRRYDELIHGTYYPPSQWTGPRRHYESITRAIRGREVPSPSLAVEIGPEDPASTLSWTSRAGIPIERVRAFDVSESSVERLRAAGVAADHLDVSVDPLPLQDGSVGVVVMSEVIEHLLNPDFALRQLRRVLGSQGFLVLTTPNLAAWFNRVQLMMGLQPVFTETGTEWVFGRGPLLGESRPVGHLQVYTRRAISRLLAYHGFTVTRISGFPVDPELIRSRALRALDSVLSRVPDMAGGILVEAVVSEG